MAKISSRVTSRKVAGVLSVVMWLLTELVEINMFFSGSFFSPYFFGIRNRLVAVFVVLKWDRKSLLFEGFPFCYACLGKGNILLKHVVVCFLGLLMSWSLGLSGHLLFVSFFFFLSWFDCGRIMKQCWTRTYILNFFSCYYWKYVSADAKKNATMPVLNRFFLFPFYSWSISLPFHLHLIAATRDNLIEFTKYI